MLQRGPLSVGDIAKQFTVSRPAISQHLRILKDADLVTDSAEATRRCARTSTNSGRPHSTRSRSAQHARRKRRLKQDCQPKRTRGNGLHDNASKYRR
ncbi:MAG: ArsR family transcriptional regulator [Gemmatimonadaceae bacterium]